MRNLFDKTLLRFLLVGVGNTLLSTAMMYLLYNLGGLGYWPSTALAYIAGSIMSFILNRSYTFQSKEKVWTAAWKFALNVAVCYVIAYSAARPAVEWALGQTNWTQQLRDNLAMLTGLVLFTGLNYLGQRFFAFRARGNAEGDR